MDKILLNRSIPPIPHKDTSYIQIYPNENLINNTYALTDMLTVNQVCLPNGSGHSNDAYFYNTLIIYAVHIVRTLRYFTNFVQHQ